MVIKLETFSLNTRPEDIIDITPEIKKKLRSTGQKEGIVCVFTASSTSAISTTEFEPGLVKGDIPTLLEKIIPYNRDYDHHKTWGDHNGGGHLRSFLLNPSLIIPFTNSDLILGTWQQVIFLEMDEKKSFENCLLSVLGRINLRRIIEFFSLRSFRQNVKLILNPHIYLLGYNCDSTIVYIAKHIGAFNEVSRYRGVSMW